MANKSKAVRTINNNTAYQIVNAAYKQAVGSDAVDTVDLSDFVDSGKAYEDISNKKDIFFKALLDQVVNFYTETSYESEFNDLYYVESRRFANIVQMINITPASVEPNHAFKSFAPDTSTTPPTYATIGTYKIVPFTVNTDYFSKENSWELNLPITRDQLTNAFKSEEELRGFVDFEFVCCENALKQHRENMNSLNRNSAIGNLILAHDEGIPGIHKLNLLEKYNKERGKHITSVADFMADADALRYAGSQITLFSKYMRKPSTLFNLKGLVKFCPAERLVLEVNSAFENAINEVALSNTFHSELAEMPKAVSTPCWQGWGINSVSDSTEAAAFDQVTKIDVTLDKESSITNTNATISQSGIVAFMADQYAIMHTIRSQRTGVQTFDIENLELFSFQSVDQYFNNLGQNALVFTVEAPVSPTPSAVGMNTRK